MVASTSSALFALLVVSLSVPFVVFGQCAPRRAEFQRDRGGIVQFNRRNPPFEAPTTPIPTAKETSTTITDDGDREDSSKSPFEKAKDFCTRYSLDEGCVWKTAAGFGVLLAYALVIFAFISVGCTDRGWCVVIK
ncbi:hypothetical protein L596_014533 [Steinernema carpocapsae]|uniref:Transmembrane protein n=1 Tax=Steinernema carpocapsae TaxID=34508 RepID=A0A4U5ND33_STECR|nr:hypothetical protein L596_014533 [Steinernema carpocapsae]